MKIRMVDVAEKLGLSKATVSLAVNGKPGVSEETRARVFACIRQMEEMDSTFVFDKGQTDSPAEVLSSQDTEQTEPDVLSQRIIKVIFISHDLQVLQDPEMDLWSGVLSTFDSQARKLGYLFVLSYIHDNPGEIESVIEECNQDLVAGVILYGTEMQPADEGILERIHKPLILYDYEPVESRYSSVCIDNREAVQMGLRFLRQSGARNIVYLSTSKEIYNFHSRRHAFDSALLAQGASPRENRVPLGRNITEITQNAADWLTSHPLPDAFLLENFQVSVGVTAALHELKIRIPDQIRLAGIDAVPRYMLSGESIPQIQVPHAERAQIAVDLLDREIREPLPTKVRIYAAVTMLP